MGFYRHPAVRICHVLKELILLQGVTVLLLDRLVMRGQKHGLVGLSKHYTAPTG